MKLRMWLLISLGCLIPVLACVHPMVVTLLGDSSQASLSPTEKLASDLDQQRQDKQIGPLLASAYTAASNEDWASAIGPLKQAIGLTPKSSMGLLHAYHELADCYDRLGSSDKSDEARRSALSLGELLLKSNAEAKWSSAVTVALVDLYLGLNQPTQQDLARCDELLEKKSSAFHSGELEDIVRPFNIRHDYAVLRNRQNRPAEALAYADEGLGLTGSPFSQAVCIYERAVAHEALGKKQQAIQDYQKCLRMFGSMESVLPAQFKAANVVLRLSSLGAIPQFNSERTLIITSLRLWAIKGPSSLSPVMHAPSAVTPGETWLSKAKVLEQAPRPGKIEEIVKQSTSGNTSSWQATVMAGSGAKRAKKTVNFQLVTTDSGVLVKDMTVDGSPG